LSRSKHTVIAAVRDLSAPTSASLKDVKVASSSSLIVVKIDSNSATDPEEAVKEIKAKGITALDIVIANAGIANIFSKVEDIEIADLRSFFEVNTVRPLVLYKAVFPLLQATADAKGPGAPKFVGITSNAASITWSQTRRTSWVLTAPAKPLNYLIRRAHFEHTWLTAFIVNPA
jgi:norsolorinic acid ketoreductase